MRYEVAMELGLDAIHTGDFGQVSCAQCGKFGQVLQRRAQTLLNNRHELNNRHKPRH